MDIESFYQSKLGPGKLFGRRSDDRVYGVIVPYSFAGECAAWSYKMIAEYYFPETYIIILPALENSVVLEDVETSFGAFKVDKELGEVLVKNGFVENKIDDALNIQLLFLQHASLDRINELKVLPIFISNKESYEKVIDELLKVRKDIVVIIGLDFSFLDVEEFNAEIEENVISQDMLISKMILDLNADEYFNYASKIDLFGKEACFFGIELLKKLGVNTVELLSYCRSDEIDGKKNNTLGFVSMVFMA